MEEPPPPSAAKGAAAAGLLRGRIVWGEYVLGANPPAYGYQSTYGYLLPEVLILRGSVYLRFI